MLQRRRQTVRLQTSDTTRGCAADGILMKAPQADYLVLGLGLDLNQGAFAAQRLSRPKPHPFPQAPRYTKSPQALSAIIPA